jgi:hypothetical protein
MAISADQALGAAASMSSRCPRIHRRPLSA